jgi:GNAT superfamily N-acetyltransferase
VTRGTLDIRPATDDDLVGAMRVLDAGLLDTDADTVRRRIAGESVLVADADGRVVGAVVLGERPAWVAAACEGVESPDGRHVEAVAVGRSRRGQGVGTALLRAACESVEGPLTADFAASVRPFYESLGCRIETVGESHGDGAERRLVARVKIAHTNPTQSGDGEADG